MTMSEQYWYEKIVKKILEVNTDVLFIVDKLGFSDFPDVKSMISERYPYIFRYDGEIKLAIWLRKKQKPLIVRFNCETDIPYHMLSKYSVITLDADIIFPLLDKNIISAMPLKNYQPIYEFYRNNIENKAYERLSKEDTEKVIAKSISTRDIRQLNHISELESQIKRLLSRPITKINEWIDISGELSKAWGELLYILDTTENDNLFEDIRNSIENKFKNEIVNYYDDTTYDSNLPLHWNIINRIYRDSGNRKAIICFDCMGFEEWNVIKEYLITHGDYKFNVGHSLAVIPTETNFSRTTIFSGTTPKKLINSGIVKKMDTRYEERLFRQALRSHGIHESDIFYQRAASPNDLDIDFNSFHDFSWIGLVFTFIDTLTHNRLTNKRKLIRDIQEFLDKSNMHIFISKLLGQGFHLYFVSDHGSIYAKGNGIQASKDLADEEARRFMIFEYKELARDYETENTILIRLDNVIGDKWLLLACGNEMFGNSSSSCLTHGGISIEEVVVPFVKVIKDERF